MASTSMASAAVTGDKPSGSGSKKKNEKKLASKEESRFLSSIMGVMNNLRKQVCACAPCVCLLQCMSNSVCFLQGTLCDVILVVQGKHIPAHRVVLAAASHFFSLMFTSEYITNTLACTLNLVVSLSLSPLPLITQCDTCVSLSLPLHLSLSSQHDGVYQSRGGVEECWAWDHRTVGGVCLHRSVRHTHTQMSIHMGHLRHKTHPKPCVCFSISVNSSNVQSLLDAANQYQIEPVKKMCVDFLKEQVDATNCLGKTCLDSIHL